MLWDSTKDTFLDLTDIAYINVGVGDGLLAEVQLTKLGHFGLGWADTVRAGFRPRAIGVWSQRQAEYGISLFYWRDINRQAVYATSTLFDQSMSYKGFDLDHQSETGHWLDFGVHVHALLIGVEANASPKETLDFAFSLVNWVITLIPIRSGLHELGVDHIGFDVGSDDTNSRLKEMGGSSAGAVYQGETPFFERPRDGTSVKHPDPPVEKGNKKK
ncbi:MAG: hypothetical protein ACKVS6_14985 [Planctomycetota bacterium]